MATKYYALLTNVGAAKLANATALGEQVEITQMAVGDGNGSLPTPDPAQTALVHELRRAPLNTLTIDPVNTNQILAEQVIPEDVGGWWIREIGLYDRDGDMIAVANCAETYKPQLQEGSGRVQVIRVILIVSSTEAVTLKIDPSVVLATREYVDSKDDAAAKKAANLSDLTNIAAARRNLVLGTAATKDVGVEAGQVMAVGAFGLGTGIRPRDDAYCNQGEIFRVNSASKNAPGSGVYGVLSLPCDGSPSSSYIAISNSGAGHLGRSAASGIVKWSRIYSTDNKPAASDVGAWSKSEADGRYLQLTGGTIKKLVIKPQSDDGEGEYFRIESCAHTPFVLVRSSTTNVSMGFQVSGRPLMRLGVGIDNELHWGAEANQITNPRIYTTAKPPTASEVGAITRTDSPVGVPLPWPSQNIPTGWLKCNGATFDKTKYPLLAQAYPSGRLPDLRGEFIRGFDDGRSADSGRALLSAQAATLLRTGAMEYYGADGTGDDGAVGMGFANEDALQTTMPHGAKTPTGTLQPASGTLNDNAMIGKTNTKWVAEGSRWIALRPRNIAFNYIVRAA